MYMSKHIYVQIYIYVQICVQIWCVYKLNGGHLGVQIDSRVENYQNSGHFLQDQTNPFRPGPAQWCHSGPTWPGKTTPFLFFRFLASCGSKFSAPVTPPTIIVLSYWRVQGVSSIWHPLIPRDWRLSASRWNFFHSHSRLWFSSWKFPLPLLQLGYHLTPSNLPIPWNPSTQYYLF